MGTIVHGRFASEVLLLPIQTRGMDVLCRNRDCALWAFPARTTSVICFPAMDRFTPDAHDEHTDSGRARKRYLEFASHSRTGGHVLSGSPLDPSEKWSRGREFRRCLRMSGEGETGEGARGGRKREIARSKRTAGLVPAVVHSRAFV